ncbi:pyridoxamine 5'-phosphate oxidase family protein [Dongia deserti]|uniref:pyridoxamine 5'-phosphate oxidase family protein n=1 Tax=Dongia deserti TaxID=2268030 RepID=UPI000E650DBD|nr:pyridoxamine 5'-phosphate oxidase family protein [Dongia deserti]
MTAFTPTHRSKVKRLHERGRYDEESVFAILDAGLVAHIGYVIDGQPYVTPTAYWRRGRTLYWHGSSASRMLRTQKDGVQVCVTVSLLDGLVVARSGFHHSINYRAVMAFGRARIIEDAKEKEAELDYFIERIYPGRVAALRPVNQQELKGTTLLAMEIEEASAKVRVGEPKDDEEDYALDIWAGVIPIRQVVGAIETDPRLKPGVAMPEHLNRFSDGARFDSLLSESTGRLAKAAE